MLNNILIIDSQKFNQEVQDLVLKEKKIANIKKQSPSQSKYA